MMHVIDILAQLGGPRDVARALSLPYTTVHSWQTRGFPAVRCIEIRNLAAERGVSLTLEQIIEAQGRADAPPSLAKAGG